MPTVKDVVVCKPDDTQTTQCQSWPVWSCQPSTFEWEYTQTEKCLLIEGQVTVTDLPDSGQSVRFGPGDYVIFQKGLKCTWNIQTPVRKYYAFE